ncbi:MAG TPA: transposase [Bacteroidales bacterium]|nr:transposase [Bacteroidales bacterium]
MHPLTQHLYHWTWGTYRHKPVLAEEGHHRLFGYLKSQLTSKKCHVYKINGTSDHLHIIASLHPELSLSSLIRELKVNSGFFIRFHKVFPEFEGWQTGYTSVTHSIFDLPDLIRHIGDQKNYHLEKTFNDELTILYERMDIIPKFRCFW